MLRRNLSTPDVQKAAKNIARIVELKLEGLIEEANLVLQEVLEEDYGITYDELLESDDLTFHNFLIKKAFGAEKLDLLSQLLYCNFDSLANNDSNRLLAKKLQQVYNFLAVEHHTVSMLNLDRQKIIEKSL